MSADEPNTLEDAAVSKGGRQKKLLAHLRPSVPDWRPIVKRAAGAIAAVAAVGAVLSGLTGYLLTYKTVGELLGHRPSVTSQSKPGSTSAPRLSIAVMPFDNLSGDASQDYFGNGIVENLTTDLSVNIANLLVIASGSSLTYKGQKIDTRQVGRELNVRYLLLGSVLRTGNQVRINARLIDAETGEQLWADRFDGDNANIFSLQDQITARISTSLRFAFVNVGVRQAQKHSNPDAFDMMLRAQAALIDERRLNINPRRQARDYYRKALALEPDNADAEIGLAGVLAENLSNSRSLAGASRPSPDQVTATRAEILELLQSASSTTAASSDAHRVRASLYVYDRKFDDARQELERALSINPNNVNALYLLAANYILSGMPEKALPVFDEHFIRTAGKIPGYRVPLRDWGSSYLLLGRWNEAAAKYQQALALLADPETSGGLAVALVKAGNREAAKAQYEIFREWYTARNGTPPTIKRLKDNSREWSPDPEFLKLYDATVLDGFRNLGTLEE
ncbi:TolB amino-terminal domain-containing protein [Bradyrhizobium canariense]|uniref:TolB amino-terminal domain-containing protein n=1 Tax=Bradyrhizobium canariense TaxID=255045 RepID=A0A1H1TCJ4_9BRAD|nr:TolB amino-terminal domain-containing protein [Bradyrhizobium canariense]